MARSLYICYFGLREPLVQTQVLPYLRELRKDGHEMILLTFEPEFAKSWPRDQIAEEKEKLLGEGIEWQSLPYHKRPSALATAYDIFRGAWRIRGLIGRRKIDILHGRVHVPTLMGALARKFSRRKPKLLFDIRGFFPEEYTDAGIWPENGWLYRSAKRVERWLMREADGFVVLTEKARNILFPESAETGSDKIGRPVEVIPCCVDLSKFACANNVSRQAMRAELNIGTRRTLVYVGSFGGWYLSNEMMEFFVAAREANPSTFILVLTQRDKEKVVEGFRTRGFSDQDFLVASVHPSEIPEFLSACDIAVSFIKACYSKLSSSPTKIAEYLACGLPIAANPGVGDVDDLLVRNSVGALIENFDRDSYIGVLNDIERMDGVRERCIAVSKREFDLLEVGGPRYRSLYEQLMR